MASAIWLNSFLAKISDRDTGMLLWGKREMNDSMAKEVGAGENERSDRRGWSLVWTVFLAILVGLLAASLAKLLPDFRLILLRPSSIKAFCLTLMATRSWILQKLKG